MPSLIAGLILAGLLAASPAQAAHIVKHSGQVLAIDPIGRTIRLQEMGPWARSGAHLMTRSFRLAPATKIELTRRSANATPGGWPGGFTESPLSASDIHPGDYATVTSESRADRLVAVSVEIVRPKAARHPASGYGEPHAARPGGGPTRVG